MMNRKYIVQIFLILFFSLLYFLNINHENQQVTYADGHVKLSESILTDFKYTHASDESKFATYPMWGYPIFLSLLGLIGFQHGFVFYFQYLLLLVSLLIFFKRYDFFENTFIQNLLIVLLFVFYTMVLSVKWPDAIVAFLLFLTALFHVKRKFIWAACMLAIAYHFRSEMLLFLIAYLSVILVQHKQIKVLLSLFLISPYVLTNLYFHKAPIFTTTNSGGVLYISLGQLPNNPWNRAHKDEEAYEYIHQKTEGKIVSPWVREAKPILFNQFKKDVIQHPFYFIKKVAYNLYSLVMGGFYNGEYDLFFIKGKEVSLISAYYKQNKQQFLKDLFFFKKKAVGKAFDWGMHIVSQITLWLVLLYLYKRYCKENFAFYFMIIVQVGICMLIQYEPRHMSKLMGIMLISISASSFQQNKGYLHEKTIY